MSLATRPPFLALRSLGKQFGRITALRDVSLDIEEGEFLAVTGPSGCGKTTLLRALAGLDPATSGLIRWNGQEVTALPAGARDIGVVFQSYALFPNLNAAENIAYGLRGRAWPKARRVARVAELLDLVGLAPQARAWPAQLSGGQQQRVALARALAPEPGLLLLDEPLSALDATVRLHLRQEIRALQRRLGITTVMVTHDQEAALAVADRVAVMRAGRLEQVGTPAQIYGQPATAFIAGFIGRAARFDAVVDATPGMILAAGHRLPAEAARGLLYGTAIEAFVRPEDLLLGAAAQGQAGRLEMRVADVEFLGALCRISLDSGRLRMEAEMPVRDCPEPGATLTVAIPRDRLLIFPA